jgi:hypothetical protein
LALKNTKARIVVRAERSMARTARRRSSLGCDCHDLLVAAAAYELDDAGRQGEERVIFAHADIFAGVELSAALAQDDVAGTDFFAAEFLDAEALGIGVATVARRPQALLMGETLKVNVERHFEWFSSSVFGTAILAAPLQTPR